MELSNQLSLMTATHLHLCHMTAQSESISSTLTRPTAPSTRRWLGFRCIYMGAGCGGVMLFLWVGRRRIGTRGADNLGLPVHPHSRLWRTGPWEDMYPPSLWGQVPRFWRVCPSTWVEKVLPTCCPVSCSACYSRQSPEVGSGRRGNGPVPICSISCFLRSLAPHRPGNRLQRDTLIVGISRRSRP